MRWRTSACPISPRGHPGQFPAPGRPQCLSGAEFPAGQWDYQLFYQENFDQARTVFEANVRNTVKALFRKGNPAGKGKPSRTAMLRQAGGWFGSASEGAGPATDTDVLSEEELHKYVAALEHTGFFGPDAYT